MYDQKNLYDSETDAVPADNSRYKIYLIFNTVIRKRTCSITDRVFETRSPLYFCIQGDPKRPVAPEIALEIGFVMDPADFTELQRIIDIYRTLIKESIYKETIEEKNAV